MSKKTQINPSYLALITLGLIASLLTTAVVVKTYPLFLAKALFFCQQLVANSLFKIPHSLPGTLIFSGGIVFSLGIISFLIQLTKTNLLIKNISGKRIKTFGKVLSISRSLGLDDKILLVQDNNFYSFCFGLFKPRIAVTTGLVNSLSDKELEAVLLHERTHLQNRDPVKILLGKTIVSTFFFLPLFRELYQNMEATNELLADRMTIKWQNKAKYLRRALQKIITQPQVTPATVPGIFHPDYIDIRVSQLINSAAKIQLNISYTSVLTVIIFTVVSLFVWQTPVDAFHTKGTPEPSYFVCSTDSTCKQECHHNNQMSSASSPKSLFVTST